MNGEQLDVRLTEINSGIKAVNGKLDSHIRHQREILSLKFKPIEIHLEESPGFRDKIVKVCESLRINWVLTLLLISGAVGGFYWVLRTKI